MIKPSNQLLIGVLVCAAFGLGAYQHFDGRAGTRRENVIAGSEMFSASSERMGDAVGSRPSNSRVSTEVVFSSAELPESQSSAERPFLEIVREKFAADGLTEKEARQLIQLENEPGTQAMLRKQLEKMVDGKYVHPPETIAQINRQIEDIEMNSRREVRSSGQYADGTPMPQNPYAEIQERLQNERRSP